MDFNKEKCLKLMRESEKLRQQGKLLWNYDKTKYKELTRYCTFLWDDIFWQSRNQYLQIIESFISRKIDGEEFANQFGNLRGENMNASDMREANLEGEMNLQLNPKSSGFTKIISDIYAHIDTFDPDLDNSESSIYGIAITEEYLRIVVKDDYLPRICAYCKES